VYCWARFGLQQGAVESQKNPHVNILVCWLNTQHGWGLGLQKKTPSGRPTVRDLEPPSNPHASW